MKPLLLLFVGLCLTIMLHAEVPINATITAGNLKAVLTSTEHSTVTNLTVTGNMDARDFKTIRDDMPMLAVLDLTGVSLVAYTGTEGTSWRTGYPANEIPEYAFCNEITGCKTSLLSILIPSSATSIGESAFSGCSGLTSISIHSLVTTIKQSAFSGCSSLTTVTIPSSVTTIGGGAFAYCGSLTSIVLPSSVRSIEDGTFWDCSGLISIDIPSSVTSIGGSAFLRCISLVSVTIPPTVMSIGESAFDGCSSWTGALTIPSVTTIGKLAFNNCSNLTSVALPSSLTSIGESAFSGCSGLAGTLTIPSSVTFIGSWAFNNCSSLIGSLIIPPLVASIKNHSFSGCSGITSLTIPSSITFIGSAAFKGCTGLTSIDSHSPLPVQLDYSLEVFYGLDKSTTTLNVPYGAMPLYASATVWKDFTTVIAHTQGILLSSKTLDFDADGGSDGAINLDANIEWTASYDQSWLTVSPTSGINTQLLTITVEPNLSTAFRKGIISFSSPGIISQTIIVTQKCAPRTITVTAGGLSAALTTEEKSTITSLAIYGTIDARDFQTIRNEFPLLAELDLSGATIAAYTDNNIKYPVYYPENTIPREPLFYEQNHSLNRLSGLTSVILPSSLISIGDRAFMGCTGLTSMIVPPSTITIDQEAFMDCSGLTSCTLPPSITSIGQSAFYGCSALTSIVIPTGISNIESGTFSDCSALTFIDIPSSVTSIGYRAFSGCSQLPSLVISPSVTSIASEAFSNCSELASVVISSTVTSITDGTFQGCSGLTSLNIPGSVNSIGQAAFFGCRNLTSIVVNRLTPADLTYAYSVFYEVNKNTCTLFVPYGSSGLYTDAIEWKGFTNIVEMKGFILSPAMTTIEAQQGSTAMAELTTDATWTASCDQTWLTLNPTSGTGNQSFTFTADANIASTTRTATVTIYATDRGSQTIVITQQTNPVGLIDMKENIAEFKCYPNPFTQEVAIEIQNPKQTRITVDIYNIAGQRVKKLAIGNSDEHINLMWNGTNEIGQQVTPGVYICKINNKSKQLIFGGH